MEEYFSWKNVATAKFSILRNCTTKLIKLKGYYRILWNFPLIYGLQKAGVFSEYFLLYLWKWNVHGTSQISLQFLKLPNLAVCVFFLDKYSTVWSAFCIKCLLRLVLWNEHKNCFSGYGWNGNQENGVFVVSMAMFA